MKKKLGSKSAVLLSAALVAALGVPIVGSATGLANAPIHVRAQNSADKSFSAIKPGLKIVEPGGSSSGVPTAAPTSTPAPTSAPVPTETPAPTTPPAAPSAPASDFTWEFRSTSATIKKYNGTSTDVVIPSSYKTATATLKVDEISANAFTDTPVVSVTIPDSFVSVGVYAFYNAKSLKSVSLPSTLRGVSNYAFYGAPLESLKLPDSLIAVGDYAFYGSKFTDLVLPDKVTYIGRSAFFFGKISNLTLSKTLTTISENAFLSNSISKVTIPGTVTSIGDRAFGGLNPLTAIYMEGNAPSTLTVAGDYGSFGVASGKTVYYKPGATGYAATWKGYKTATY